MQMDELQSSLEAEQAKLADLSRKLHAARSHKVKFACAMAPGPAVSLALRGYPNDPRIKEMQREYAQTEARIASIRGQIANH